MKLPFSLLLLLFFLSVLPACTESTASGVAFTGGDESNSNDASEGEDGDDTGSDAENGEGDDSDSGEADESGETEESSDEDDASATADDTDDAADTAVADSSDGDSDTDAGDTGDELDDTASASSDTGTVDTDDATEDTTESAVVSEDWEMALAVDNQFDVYFGTPYETEGECVGRGTEWYRQYLFTATGKKPTDHLYVATTSDRDTAQGFIGVFKNITRDKTVVTGDDVWQVFPAGAYEETNPYWPDPWPVSELPTQEQVDVAIRFAQENSLWVTPYSDVAYDNNLETNVNDTGVWSANPWGNHYDDIPDDALWIWHDSGKIEDTSLPGAFVGGNHDEFLIFRVAGQLQIVLE